jgi:hypothetical protein
MNQLIKLTRTFYNTPIYIGIEAIVTVHRDGDETVVVLNSGRHSEYSVKETPDEIYCLIHNTARGF